LEFGAHLIEFLFEIGPNNGSFTEINNWKQATGINLSSFDASMIRRLSVAYMNEYNQASDPARPAPYRTTIDRDAVDKGFRALAARMKGK